MLGHDIKNNFQELLRNGMQTIIANDEIPVRFLRTVLLIFSFSSLFFFLLPESTHNRYANVYAALGGFMLFFAAAHRAWYIPILHLTGSLIVALTVYAAANAGGINAIVLIWLTILPLMALIVGGLKAGLIWAVLVQVILLAVLFSTSIGLLTATVPMSGGMLISVMFNWLFCLLSPFLVVMLYDHLHKQRAALLQQENTALQAAQQALSKAQAHKDEFIAAIGHELRTPMSAILGLNSLLREQLTDQPEAYEAAVNIRTSTQQLLSLINNILDFSQLKAGEMKLQPNWLNPAEAVQTVVTQLQSTADQKNIQIQIEQDDLCQTPVWLDALRFQQVATNLIKNAIQHAKGCVLIRLTQQSSPQSLLLEVCDDGQGPTLQHKDTLFRQFMLNNPSSLSTEQGTGLGLTICKLLLDLHQGRIGIKTYQEQYTCFWAEWPLNPHTAPSPSHATSPTHLQNQALHIAIVDDYPINLMLNKRLVSKAFPKSQLHCLNNAAEAQAFLSNHPCDIMFVDFLMPGISGFELAQWVREQPRPIQSVALIGLTASSLQQDWDQGIASGMSAILTKPIDKHQLLQAVAQALGPHNSSGHNHA